MGKDYNISKTSGACLRCRKELGPDEEFVAVVRQVEEEFHREDYCLACWQSLESAGAAEEADLFGIWRAQSPRTQGKKKLFIDDGLLIDFFHRLDGATDDLKLSFRYVLALVLMRKKLLVYDRMERSDDGADVWLMHLKGDGRTHRVVDPKMNPEKIAEVSSQLGQILEGEL